MVPGGATPIISGHVCGGLWMRVTFESVGSAQQTGLPSEGQLMLRAHLEEKTEDQGICPFHFVSLLELGHLISSFPAL